MPDCLCIAISQSGETADTLAAMRLARQAGARVLAVTNIVGSQATREADGVLFTRAGLEIGVAATKTFLTQVLAMLLLSLYFAEQRGHLSAAEVRGYTEELRHIPALLRDYLEDGAAAKVEDVAKKYAASRFFLCLGRNMSLPVALEGALKLKEISYIPTEAYAAGEMKHGPIALLEEGSPVLVVATDSRGVRQAHLQRAGSAGPGRARDRRGIRGQRPTSSEMADEILFVPRTDEMLAPLALHRAAAAVRLLRGQAQGREGGPAAQPGQDRHGGVDVDGPGAPQPEEPAQERPGARALAGLDLVEVARFERALRRHPGLEQRRVHPGGDRLLPRPGQAGAAPRGAVRGQGSDW